jgi:hypothetical protein
MHQYAGLLRVHAIRAKNSTTFFITCSHGITIAGRMVFAVLGRDRILYTAMDNEIGKEYAVRVLMKIAWNVKIIKVGREGKRFRYTIPLSFAKALNIKKGDYVLALSTREDTLEIIPLGNVLEKIGKFEEPII